ncbi:uncharacterized protein N7518_002778 [Penicillium psychrosexuale]|uniref:uncharacterized protein n=1 Tax=Penicillium psychrosexuale TaxID=1002107 RepID=UPI002544DDF1|nr:uncharacterized protein N7518_002778 [Penicillium psychrosexuale]KAJ5800710.1 hypothetical protein N7518_002778 [Penicillium psychrosexuale]
MTSNGKHNFTGDLTRSESNLRWYNAYAPVDPNIYTQMRPKKLHASRAGQVSLHRYQSGVDTYGCYLTFKVRDSTTPKIIASISNAPLEFSIRGGAEIPYLQLVLKLKGEKVTNNLRMVWTAWDGDGNLTNRVPTFNADTQFPITLSARLSSVTISKTILDNQTAKLCQGSEGAEGYVISWAWTKGPHCFDHMLPNSVLQSLDSGQRKSVHDFQELGRNGWSITVTTRARAHLLMDWNAFSAMPNPTPPPYPYYNCSYVKASDIFSVIDTIPSVSDEIIQIHHRKRQLGWQNAPLGDHKYEPEMQLLNFFLNAPLTFINEREYEAVKMIGLLRETAAQEEAYIHQFNRTYEFELIPMPGSNTKQGEPSDYYYAVLEVMTIHNEDINLEQILPLPEPGTPVEIDPCETISPEMRGSSKSRKWVGKVISSSVLDRVKKTPLTSICIQIKRAQDRDSIGRVLRLEGHVRFGYPQVAIVQARKAIRYAMYGNDHFEIPRENKMKQLLLGNENTNIEFFMPSQLKIDRQAEIFLRSERTLNTQQIRAVSSAFNFGATFRSFMGLIEAPPGTGKTQISAVIAKFCFKHNKPLLIVCGSNYGLDVIANRIREVLNIDDPTGIGFYRLDTDFGETPEMQMSPEMEGAEGTDATRQNPSSCPGFQEVEKELRERGISDNIWTTLTSAINSMTAPGRSSSLGRQIMSRINEAVSSGRLRQAKLDEESQLMLEFLTFQELLRREGRTFLEPADYEDALAVQVHGRAREGDQDDRQSLHQMIVQNYRRWWLALQEFYLSRAKVVLCTASTAGRKSLRTFKPQIVLIEEASQIIEPTCLIAVMRNYSKLQKVILSGDRQQLPPVVISAGKNECFPSDRMSLFERMLQTGCSTVQLNTQYRMAQNISDFVSTQYYHGRLETHTSCVGRPKALHFANFMTKTFVQIEPGTSYFVSVNNSILWKQKNGTSVFNPDYVQFIGQLVEKLMLKNFLQEDILILSFYSEERNLLDKLIRLKLGYKKIRISSVDAAQGTESTFVILSTTRPGKPWGMGFINNLPRQCVSLSRARDGLIVVGHQSMGLIDIGNVQVPGGLGAQAWHRLVRKHEADRRIITWKSRDHTWLKEKLGVPNENQYMVAPVR